MEAEIVQIIQEHPNFAYLAVFGVLLACGLGFPMPEDIFLLAAGYTVYLAAQNDFGSPRLIPMIIVGLVGVLSGDIILFLAGKILGPRATRIWPFRLIVSERRMARVCHFFERYGAGTAFVARFMAGLRAPTFLLAGAARMRFRTFIAADGIAALISVPVLVWLAWHFGEDIQRVKHWLHQSKYAIGAIVLVAAIVITIKVIRHRRSKSN